MYILDTNIISHAIKTTPQGLAILENIEKKVIFEGSEKKLYTSVVAFQEVVAGIEEARRQRGLDYKREHFENQLEFIEKSLIVLDYTKEMAIRFAKLNSKLNKNGQSVSSFDLMIAATALEIEMTLVTANTKHFKDIPRLKYENWTEMPEKVGGQKLNKTG